MGSGSSKTAEGVLPDVRLEGKVAVITGPTAGIGTVTAMELASRGAHVILIARSAERLNKLMEDIRKDNPNAQLTSVIADLASLEQVRSAAEQILALNLHIDFLINNAGICAPAWKLTADGFESQIASNCLGHFYLTQQLIPRMSSSSPSSSSSSSTPSSSNSDPARIIFVSSTMHAQSDVTIDNLAKVFSPQNENEYAGGWKQYGNTKLINVLHAREFQQRYKDSNIVVFSLHPGVIKTEISRGYDSSTLRGIVNFVGWTGVLKSPSQGSYTTMSCVVQPLKDDNKDGFTRAGGYCIDGKCDDNSLAKFAKDDKLQKAVWDYTNNVLQNWINAHPKPAAQA